MHDPSFLALEVLLPWPVRERWRDATVTARWSLGRSTRTNAENLGEPTYPWWNLRGYRPVLAGRSFRFTALVDVWHDEPGGRDSGEVCHYPHGLQLLRHLRHLHLRVPALMRARRRLLTRCAWCGGRSGKGSDTVNVQQGGRSGRPERRWWRGEPDLLHQDCSGVERSHGLCLCVEPQLNQRGYGDCGRCGLFRAWGLGESSRRAYLVGRGVAPGSRPTLEERERIRAAWAVVRNEEAAVRDAEAIIDAAMRAGQP